MIGLVNLIIKSIYVFSGLCWKWNACVRMSLQLAYVTKYDVIFTLWRNSCGISFLFVLCEYVNNVVLLLFLSPRGRRPGPPRRDVLWPRCYSSVLNWVVSQPAGSGTFHHITLTKQCFAPCYVLQYVAIQSCLSNHPQELFYHFIQLNSKYNPSG